MVKRKRKIKMEGQEPSGAGSRDGPVSAVLWSQRVAPRSNNDEDDDDGDAINNNHLTMRRSD